MALLRLAEPDHASGTYIERVDETVVAATVFAYRRGGAWALLNSRQGLRVSDAHGLWSAERGGTSFRYSSPPGYHSGALRDMLVPRHRSLAQPRPRERLGEDAEPCWLLDREAVRVSVLGEPRFPEWRMDIDTETGVVLADRLVDAEGRTVERTFVALDLQTRLPDALFDWTPRPRDF